MKMERVKLVSFSPTGTTRAVVRAVADGLGTDGVEVVDATRPEVRGRPLHTAQDELLVIGVPVYMGRVPALASAWLRTLDADGTPAVCVVVYGNRAFEDALLELKDLVAERGCVPVACAAYVGEHSFSVAERPVAQGRPDAADLEHARAFGRQVRDKLAAAASVDGLADPRVPGASPYGGRTELWDVDFIEVSDACVQCGACAEACPVGAIDPRDSAAIDIVACITCCACLKACPQNARTMKPGPVMDASKRLHTLFSEPKTPECFL